MAGTLRLVQYNVHRFVSPTSAESTLAPIAAALAALRPDVLTLNEVAVDGEELDANSAASATARGATTAMPACLATLGAALGLPHAAFFGHARNGRYGNAMLSRYPLRVAANVHLDGGSELIFVDQATGATRRHRVARGMLVADIDVSELALSPQAAGGGRPSPAHWLRLATTHLDHIDVAQRATQLDHAMRALDALDAPSGARCRDDDVGDARAAAAAAAAARSVPTIFAGDLNALREEDYSSERWAAIVALNKLKGWAPPAGDEDELRIVRAGGFEDSVAQAAAGGRAEAIETSPASGGCRIDYVWSRSAALGIIRAVQSFVARDVSLSDHWPLVVDFEVDCMRSRRSTSSARL